MTTCLRILDRNGFRSNIMHHILKVMVNMIGKIVQEGAYKKINQNTEDEVLLMLEHRVDLWDKST